MKIEYFRFARRVRIALLTDTSRITDADSFQFYCIGQLRQKIAHFLVLTPIAIMALFAAPMPASADSGPGDNIAIALSSHIVESPVGYGDTLRVVPGSLVDFSVTVKGSAENSSSATSVAIVDMVPEHLALFVGDLARHGAGPAMFKDHDSGLEFSFGGLSDLEDSIEFSRDGGKTFDYVPVADLDGFDHNVTHIKLRPSGALLPTEGKHERFSLRYRMKVK